MIGPDPTIASARAILGASWERVALRRRLHQDGWVKSYYEPPAVMAPTEPMYIDAPEAERKAIESAMGITPQPAPRQLPQIDLICGWCGWEKPSGQWCDNRRCKSQDLRREHE